MVKMMGFSLAGFTNLLTFSLIGEISYRLLLSSARTRLNRLIYLSTVLLTRKQAGCQVCRDSDNTK